MASEKTPSRFREWGLSSAEDPATDAQTLEKLEGRRDSHPVSLQSEKIFPRSRPALGSSHSSFSGTPVMHFGDDQDPSLVSSLTHGGRWPHWTGC